MAEVVVSLVLETLGEALRQEVLFLSETRAQFERLQEEFVSIKAFLKTADAYKWKNPGMLVWVADVQNLANDVDDVLSTIFLKVSKDKRRRANTNILLRWVFKLRKPVDLHKMGIDISAIFTKIEDVSNRRKRYGTKLGGATSSSLANEVEQIRVYPHTKDVDIVGLEEAESSLVVELKKSDDERRRVVSICGMGGIGKTTLAKLVYNRHDVRNHFSCCAWTFISQQYKAEDVLRDILRQVASLKKEEREEIKSMNVVELVVKLNDFLAGHQYLVVLDDIWHVEAWSELKNALPDGKRGSKVMMTTRNKKVAQEADPWSHPFEPKILSEDIAWDLLCKKSFPRNAITADSSLSSDLEKCGREMLKECGGLPLAIVVLGGILCKKASLDEWETVSEEISLYLREDDRAGVHAILGLSYINLPLHMKHLFLYLGLFPEDYKISVSTVTHMWIAEGLVCQIEGSKLSMEVIGRRYWDELIERNMVQVAKRDLQGNVKACQMHDLMRDFCIEKARAENFLRIIREGDSSSSSSSIKQRRCAIYLEDNRYEFPTQASSMRTVVFLNGSGTSKSMSPNIDFKLVRVLKINDVLLPKGFNKIIGKFLHLRYLGLRGSSTRSRKFPNSIGNLVNLQSLDLTDCISIMEFPSPVVKDVIWKLEELRHFLWDFWTCYHSHPLRMDTLRKLQTLSWMKAKAWNSDMLNLVHLQKLGILELKADKVGAIIDSVVDRLTMLRSLSLRMFHKNSFQNLERLSEMHQLIKLELTGDMNSFPKQWPPKIVKLTFSSSYWTEDPMPTLEKLPHLAILKIDYAYQGKKIVCSGEGFPKLQTLNISGDYYLEEWVVEKGAMRCLRTFRVFDCAKLKMIPEGFKFISTLQELDIVEMPKEFVARVKEGGEDWESVKHIPSITANAYLSSQYEDLLLETEISRKNAQ